MKDLIFEDASFPKELKWKIDALNNALVVQRAMFEKFKFKHGWANRHPVILTSYSTTDGRMIYTTEVIDGKTYRLFGDDKTVFRYYYGIVDGGPEVEAIIKVLKRRLDTINKIVNLIIYKTEHS